MASLLTVVHWRRVALAGTWIHMHNVQQSGSLCSRNACLRVAGPPYQYWKTALRYSVNPRVGMFPSDVMTTLFWRGYKRSRISKRRAWTSSHEG